VRPEELLQELVLAQTEDLVTLRLLLNQAKLDEAKEHAPMSRLWGLDLTEDSVRVLLRGGKGGSTVLEGRLGGRIVPSQTDWGMMKVTREVAPGADGVGARQTRPALSVQLRKAPGSRQEWQEVLLQETKQLQGREEPAIGALDDEEGLPALESGEEPNREGWTAADHAKEMKAKGDDCFRKQKWEAAADFYSRALAHTPDNEKLLSNRSAAYVEAKQYQAALDDAMRAVEVAPEWPKSFFRQGVALRALRRYDMALSAFSEGKAREPQNRSWQLEIEATEEKKAARLAARARAGGPR